MIKQNAITAKDVLVEHKTARGVICALDCPEFIAPSGASIAIMGPSGCGKSTLLGVLAGLAAPTHGSVTIGSTDITGLSEPARVAFRKTNIGIVYQADNLLPFLSVSENVRLQLALSGDTDNADERISNLLQRLGLSGLENRLPDQLSGGQRQRVAIARAIVHNPAVILADEPTGALDKENSMNVVDLLRSIQKSLKSTLIVVTHDPSIASKLEQLVTLKDGRIQKSSGDFK